MRRFIAALAVGLGILVWHSEVHGLHYADLHHSGQVTVYTTCCFGTNCTTTCN
jgi:hypothetical protein